jgi:hypothetical protein
MLWVMPRLLATVDANQWIVLHIKQYPAEVTCLSFFELPCLAFFLNLSSFLYKIDRYYYAAFFHINFTKIYFSFLYIIYSIIATFYLRKYYYRCFLISISRLCKINTLLFITSFIWQNITTYFSLSPHDRHRCGVPPSYSFYATFIWD